MKVLIFPHHRFLKFWLVAVACQAGALFSQPDYYGPYPGTMPPETNRQDPSYFQEEGVTRYPYSSNVYYSQMPAGMSQDQVQSIIYPDNSPHYYPPHPTEDAYRSPSIPQNSQNGQWPSYSNNEWSSDENSYRQNSSPFPSNSSFDSEYYSDNFDAPASTSFTPQGQPSTLSSEQDKQNFITFSSDLEEMPDKEQHPLTKEGQATAYPFTDGSTSHQKSSSAKIEKKELDQPDDIAPSLSKGKSNVVVIKKHPEPVSPSRRLEEALHQPEVVVGKQIVSDPVVGLVENVKSTQPQSNPQDLDRVVQLLKETTPAHDTSSVSSSKKIANDSLIAQTTEPVIPPNRPEPALTTVPQPTPPPAEPIPSVAEPTPVNSAPPRAPTIITPTTPDPTPLHTTTDQSGAIREISINFNNVSMIEYIRFISRISNKNFIFDDEDLQFNVTIVSEEPTTVENLMAALLQELRIRDLSLIEQGNNIIIHRNPRIRSPARIVADGTALITSNESELVTRVFRLNTLDPLKASEIIRPLLSEDSLIEVLRDTNNLIITDLVTNVNKVAQLIGTLDAPNSGVSIGQYVVRNAFVDSLVDLAYKIVQPIAQGNPFVLVPHPASNSIFIVSNAFLVEKALAILQNLDLNEGRTKILSLETLQPSYPGPGEINGRRPEGPPEPVGPFPPGMRPGGPIPGEPESFPLEGRPLPFPEGIGAEGRASAIFDESRDFMPGGIGAASRWSRDLPVGHIERTLFFIYKLRYRKGDNIELALRKIANSLQLMGAANADLISAIMSSQWIESSNALIFTGTASALEKVRELILEVDVPLRQVFIEMLILDTTIGDSLNYTVDWINRFGGGTTTGEEGFINNPLTSASEVNFLARAETILPNSTGTCPPVPACPLPVATGFLNSGGFAAGVIGTHLTHNGTRFSSIGALVKAVHTDAKADIVLNPKIVTEDNNPAEIFVGGTDRYKTQSITNDLGSLVTNNFQFIDVGTTLRVTPLIGNNGIITLEIIQETTNPSATANTGGNNQDVNLVEVLTKTRTVTKVHVPDGFFVVLSGMVQDRESRSYSRIPCLGGIPIIGGFGKSQTTADDKRVLMIFIRPLIIDTDEDYEDVTRRQQDVYREKSKFRRSWNYEIDEGLEFLNIKHTDPDDMNCRCSDRTHR